MLVPLQKTLLYSVEFQSRDVGENCKLVVAAKDRSRTPQQKVNKAAQDAGKAMKTAEPRPWVPPLQSFPSPELHEDERNATRTLSGYVTHQRVTDDFVKKDFQPSQVLLANNSWQSCSATTDAAAEAVGSQVSSSPTALAAQVVTVASNTTLASDVRELTEVETWSIGDARRMPVVDAPRVNFDTRVQTASRGSQRELYLKYPKRKYAVEMMSTLKESSTCSI
eukprot:s935_g31.t1